MGYQFDPEQLAAKAAELGLIADGDPLPRHLENRVKKAILDDRRPTPTGQVVAADRIVVDPDRGVLIDGQPLGCALPGEPVEVTVSPTVSTVRITLVARRVEVHPAKENRAHEQHQDQARNPRRS